MKKTLIIFTILVGLFFIIACAPIYFGKAIVLDQDKESISVNNSILGHFEDEFVEIFTRHVYDHISIKITNKHSDTISVLWDETLFISTENTVHKVYHYGVKIVNRNQSLPPTPILSGTTLEEVIYPSDYTYYGSSDTGWVSLELFTKERFPEEEDWLNVGIGSTIGINLVLQIGEEKHNYRFYYELESFSSE